MSEPDNSDEIASLSEWSSAVTDYAETWEENSILCQHFRTVIPEIIKADDLKGMRQIFAQCRNYAEHLPSDMQAELDEILRTKIGRGLFEVLRAQEEEIASILERGRINDFEEFRLLLERANDTTNIGKDTDAINRLLADYENQRGHV